MFCTIEEIKERTKRIAINEFDIYEELVTELQTEHPSVKEKELGLNVIAFSDTHGIFSKRKRLEEFLYKHADYDICLLLGDHMYEDIDMILQYVPDHKIIGVLGNHDSPDLYEKFGLKDVHDDIITIKGVTISGMGGSYRYKAGNFPMMTQKESLELSFKMIKKAQDVDIFISHDKAFSKAMWDVAHVGLVGITVYINFQAPLYHIHGHLHQEYTGKYPNGTIEKSVFQAEYMEL